MTLYLSRLQLSQAPSARALDAVLNPEDGGKRMDAHHRLLWAVFADRVDRERDFLWREEGDGRFMTLSARRPLVSELFEAPDVKEFSPVLAVGDRLNFALRANATKTLKTDGIAPNGKRRKKHFDVVMDRLFPTVGQTKLPKEEASARSKLRMGLACAAAKDWLDGQGSRHGFKLETRLDRDREIEAAFDVSDYSTVALPSHRGKRENQPQFGIMEMSGVLTVTDPGAFLVALAAGFGRAKAFGCGLMLIRRMP